MMLYHIFKIVTDVGRGTTYCGKHNVISMTYASGSSDTMEECGVIYPKTLMSLCVQRGIKIYYCQECLNHPKVLLLLLKDL